METTTQNKFLNVEKIIRQMEQLGMSQTNLADRLQASKQSVTNWIQKKKFPRPAVLLKLAKALKLSYDEIVIKQDSSQEPVVAFRKKGNHKISSDYMEDAKDKGFLLEQVVPYLPYDKLSAPPVLIEPKLDYDYIQAAAEEVRKAIGKENEVRAIAAFWIYLKVPIVFTKSSSKLFIQLIPAYGLGQFDQTVTMGNDIF